MLRWMVVTGLGLALSACGANSQCSRLVGRWTAPYKSINVSEQGSNYLIVYSYTSGAQWQFVGPCQNGQIVTSTDWVGNLSYVANNDTAIFEHQSFARQQ
jgi:hypothetical protein